MTTKGHNEITELVREAIRELFEPIEMGDKSADTNDKIYRNLQDISQSCAPARRAQQLKQVCETVEFRLSGKVTGWLARECFQEIQELRSTLERMQSACGAFMDHVRPYNGVGGIMRSAQDLTAAPWEIVTAWFGATNYQRQRDKLLGNYFEALHAFGEAIGAFILSLESAITQQTGDYFRFAIPA